METGLSAQRGTLQVKAHPNLLYLSNLQGVESKPTKKATKQHLDDKKGSEEKAGSELDVTDKDSPCEQ